MIDIRQPNISADTPDQQLLQMRSYLYQLAQQLNWAFSTVSAGDGGSSGGTPQTQTVTVAGNAKIDPQNTFSAVKGLIMKSADIVNAYSEIIEKRIQGGYLSRSDFGTYSEHTSQQIHESSTNIQQLFQNNRELSDTVNSLYDAQVGTNAYIKTGLMYEDNQGLPVYGLEIGQTNDVNGEITFTRFARFSSDRLSFYDRNDTEIAFISDYRLYISNAEVTGALTLTGKFKIFYDHGLAFQWIGGNA